MKHFFLGATLFGLTAVAQNERYYDEQGQSISKSKFTAFSNYKNFVKSELRNDSLTIFRLEPRLAEGVLTIIQHSEILTNLEAQSGISLTGKTIVIDYYPGKDKCNSRGSSTIRDNKWKSYLEALKERPQVRQFFVYAVANENEWFPKNANAFPDKGNIIRNYFLNAHYPCGSYIIVLPDRRFTVYKGEYDKSGLLKHLDSFK